MFPLESRQNLGSFGLPYSSLLPSLLCTQPKLLPVVLLALPNLIAEVHGCEPIDKAGLILKTLLGHVERLLHRHREGDAKCEDEAAEQEDDVNEIDMVRSAPWRANERELLEVDEAVVNEGEQDGAEDHEAQIDHEACHHLHELVRAVEGQHRGERRADESRVNGITLKHYT